MPPVDWSQNRRVAVYIASCTVLLVLLTLMWPKYTREVLVFGSSMPVIHLIGLWKPSNTIQSTLKFVLLLSVATICAIEVFRSANGVVLLTGGVEHLLWLWLNASLDVEKQAKRYASKAIRERAE